jgi:hypothetical protein
VDARFAPVGDGSFRVDDDAAPYVRSLEYESGARWIPADGHGPAWVVPCAAGCRLRYMFGLREAAVALNDTETAIASGDVVVAPPATWLVRPEPAGGRFRVHVTLEAPWRFATGVRGSGARDTFEASTADIENASYAAFGAFELETVRSGSVRADVAVASRPLALSPADTARWVQTAVDAIVAYYERPFVDRVLVVVVGGQPGSPTRGETLGDGGPAVLIRAAGGLTALATRDDWVMTHELLHVSLPSLGREHAWLSEGIATYVEPVVRARAGLVTPEKYWNDLVEGVPQGLPEAGDQGLERTHTWGRTYWGGALFCFVADVAIREQTRNARSFDDALRAIVASGADVEAHWTVDRFLAEGDRATGTKVLEGLYRDMALAPGTVDLPRLWERLGVRAGSGKVTFDDGAPLAAVRRAITATRAAP